MRKTFGSYIVTFIVTYIFVVMIFVVIALILSMTGCGSEKGLYKGPVFKNHVKTAKGVNVYGAEKSTDQQRAAIDAGLDTVFQIASAPPNNYSGFTGHSSYTVWLQERSPKCQQAGFLVDASGSVYEGTAYDKDPSPTRCLICAAGMMLLNEAAPGMVVVDDIGTLQTVVRYEAEHNILWQVDLPRYAATQYHTGAGHPILGDGDNLTQPEVFQGGSVGQGNESFCVLLVH